MTRLAGRDPSTSGPRPILVLGGTGQLGRALAGLLHRRSVPFLAPPRGVLDLADPAAVPRTVEELAPRAVINAAAFTDVAGAEDPAAEEIVFRVNRDGPRVLAEICRRLGIPLVHLSTDYVFDGTRRTPYREEDPPHPLQRYGRSKLEGELTVREAHPGALVVRTSTLYGSGPRPRPHYVDAIIAQARSRSVVTVVETPVASPTHAPDLAEMVLDLLEAGAAGLLHAVNRGACSRAELARAVVEEAGLADRVEVRSRSETGGGVLRPAYSALDTERVSTVLNRRPRPWREALREYVERSKK